MSRTNVGLVVAMVPLLAAAVAVGAVEGIYGLGLGVVSLVAVVCVAARATRSGTTWYLPFLLVLIAPAVTVPTQELLLGVLTDDFAYNASLYHTLGIDTPAGSCDAVYDSGWDKAWVCPREKAALTLLPGVLNLAALGWLRSGSSRTKRSAAVAGGFGMLRLAVPAAVYLSSPQVQLFGSYQFYSGGTVDNISPGLSVTLWGLSLVAFLVFGVTTRHTDPP